MKSNITKMHGQQHTKKKSCSGSQEITRILWNLKIRSRTYVTNQQKHVDKLLNH